MYFVCFEHERDVYSYVMSYLSKDLLMYLGIYSYSNKLTVRCLLIKLLSAKLLHRYILCQYNH